MTAAARKPWQTAGKFPSTWIEEAGDRSPVIWKSRVEKKKRGRSRDHRDLSVERRSRRRGWLSKGSRVKGTFYAVRWYAEGLSRTWTPFFLLVLIFLIPCLDARGRLPCPVRSARQQAALQGGGGAVASFPLNVFSFPSLLRFILLAPESIA